ncbi:MAG: protease modulator HflC [Calditrichales bacterium]|nr:MAG: protease modulator HflC [Calditrichales bacterium]
MQNKNTIILGIISFVVLIILFSAAFVVSETEQVILTRFGKPVGKAIDKPGVYFKIPMIENANFFEKRFLEWDGNPNQIPTRDKRFIWVDAYARWRIIDPLLFFQRLRDERGAQSRLDDILDGETRNAIANHDLVDLVRATNRKPMYDEMDLSTDNFEEILSTIEFGREKITREVLSRSAERTTDLGIELLDFRFKRINYVKEVREKVYDRMITERKRIADKYRSEGQGDASRILGEKERELKRITSEAFRKAQTIIGKADAEATRIYADAYNRNAESREFYRFLKTMETYESTFSENDWLIMSSDTDFYRYMKRQSGN